MHLLSSHCQGTLFFFLLVLLFFEKKTFLFVVLYLFYLIVFLRFLLAWFFYVICAFRWSTTVPGIEIARRFRGPRDVTNIASRSWRCGCGPAYRYRTTAADSFWKNRVVCCRDVFASCTWYEFQCKAFYETLSVYLVSITFCSFIFCYIVLNDDTCDFSYRVPLPIQQCHYNDFIWQ